MRKKKDRNVTELNSVVKTKRISPANMKVGCSFSHLGVNPLLPNPPPLQNLLENLMKCGCGDFNMKNGNTNLQ